MEQSQKNSYKIYGECMKKRIILWILVILWMGIIFIFSSFNSDNSSKQSEGIINFIIENVIEIFNKDLSLEDKSLLIDRVHMPVRKLAHFSIYLVLGVLVTLLLKTYNLSTRNVILVSILICFLYACSDEIHQLFISGRSAEFRDILIDTLGSSCGIVLFRNKKIKS